MSTELEAFETETRRLIALQSDDKEVFDLKCALSKQLESAHWKACCQRTHAHLDCDITALLRCGREAQVPRR